MAEAIQLDLAASLAGLLRSESATLQVCCQVLWRNRFRQRRCRFRFVREFRLKDGEARPAVGGVDVGVFSTLSLT